MGALIPSAENLMNIPANRQDAALVLVIDDDKFMRIQLRKAMEQAGYRVAEASDGEEGLAAYQNLHPDIVLLDAMMPVMDGFTCCHLLNDLSCEESSNHPKALAGNAAYASRTPILMITSLEDRESVDRAFEAGAIDYITKPIHWAVLRQRVRRILEENRAIEALRKSEERFRTLIDTAQEGVWVVDLAAKTTYVNQRMSEMLGYSVGEMLDRSIFDFIDQSDHIEAEEMFLSRDRDVSRQHDFRFICQDGLPLWTIVSTSIILDSEGNCNGTLAMTTDISDRKEAERKVLEQAALLDVATDAIVVQTLDNKIVFWNFSAERLYGWTKAEVIGKNIERLIYPENDEQLETVKSTLTQENEWQGELYQVNKQGKEIIVESRWTFVRDSQGRPQSILAVNTNITEKKQLENQVLRAQRLESVGTLASGIAHDLNNLLAPILLSIHLLHKNSPNEQSQRLLNTLATNTKRAADLVKQVLSFARGVEGKRTLLQLRYLLLEIKQISQETFPKSIHIHTPFVAAELWNVLGDATQLHQVFMNLCVNARDAMPAGGKLTIAAENLFIDENYAKMNLEAKVGPYITITVGDTGTGINAEIIDRIFEPFFTTKEIGQGTGLGLSTALGIVKSHAGFIQVSSEVGKGTQFKVFLPAKPTPQVQIEQDRQEFELRGNGELILVVDDEKAICDVMANSLELLSYRTLTANDGIEAIALYAQHKNDISLVLLDMMMPSLDGLMTIRMLEKMNPNVKIIAMSGLESAEKIEELDKPSVKGFLQKPYTTEQLLGVLHSAIEAESE